MTAIAETKFLRELLGMAYSVDKNQFWFFEIDYRLMKIPTPFHEKLARL